MKRVFVLCFLTYVNTGNILYKYFVVFLKTHQSLYTLYKKHKKFVFVFKSDIRSSREIKIKEILIFKIVS